MVKEITKIFSSYKDELFNYKKDHIGAATDYLSLLIDLVLVNYERKDMEKLILTVPVESFDTYRSFLTKLCERKNS